MGVMEGTNNLKPLKRERAGYGIGAKIVGGFLSLAACCIGAQVVLAVLVKMNIGIGELSTPGVKLKSIIDSIDSQVDTSAYPQGMSVDDVFAVSSAQSKAATERFGNGRNVYVLENDPKLKYLLANYRDLRPEQYPQYEPDSMPRLGFRLLDNPVTRTVLGISAQEWARTTIYVAMFDYLQSAAVEIYGRDEGRNVVFLRRESTASLLGNPDIPYATPLDQVNQWSLPHELGHSWDFELYERKYGGKVRGQVAVSQEEADLIGESIADLTTALVLLRETGNDDTLRYQVLPFRTRVVTDFIHATEYLLTRTYGAFVYADVIGKSDLQLSALAIDAIESEVVRDPQGLRDFLRKRKSRSGPVHEGRTALEDSVKNLVYQGRTLEQCGPLLDAIHHHIRDFDDEALAAALRKSPFNCEEPAKQAQALKGFATAAGFKIDWHSHERLATNLAKVDAYYQTLVAVPPAP